MHRRAGQPSPEQWRRRRAGSKTIGVPYSCAIKVFKRVQRPQGER